MSIKTNELQSGVRAQLVFDEIGARRTPIRTLAAVPRVGEYVIFEDKRVFRRLLVQEISYAAKEDSEKSVIKWDVLLRCQEEV